MNVEKVESLLERSRPAPPPSDLRRRIFEAADRKFPAAPLPSRKPRLVEVMTVAASLLMLIATVSWLLREAPPASSPGAQEAGQPFEDRKMMSQFPGGEVSGFTWSPDGKHWGCAVKLVEGDTRMAVVIDGKKEKEYIAVSPPVFGADGVYVYGAQDPADGMLLIQNGVVQKGFEAFQAVSFSPDGRRLAYAARKDGLWFAFVDGKRSGPYDSLDDILWSPDGTRVALVASLGADWCCVVDGKKGEPFDYISHLRFTPDGKTLAYVAREGSEHLVVGTTAGQDYDAVGPPAFSADGSRVGHRASSQGESFVVVGPPGKQAKVSDAYDEVGSPVFSRDGKVWACRVREKGVPKEAILVGREILMQYVKRVEGKETSFEQLESHAQPGESFESVSDPVVNPDGTLVAYAAGKGSRKYLVVGSERTLKFSLIDRIAFGPDGRKLAFRAGQYGKQLVVAGDSRSDEVDEIVTGPVWSKDGRKVAFTARTGAELWSRVLEVK